MTMDRKEEEQKGWVPPMPKAMIDQEKEADAAILEIAQEEGTAAKTTDDEATPVDLLDKKEKPKEPADESDLSTLQHKYDVLQGKYDSEGRRKDQQIQELTTTVSALQATIENLNKLLIQLREQKPADRAEPGEGVGIDTGEDGDLTEKDFDGYGPEMAKLFSKVSRLEQENATLKAQVGKVDHIEQAVTRNEEQAVRQEAQQWEARMNALCPYTEVNEDPAFLEWLKRGNGSKLKWAQTCSDARDADSLRDIVDQFIRETKWVSTKEREPGDGLEGQVVPDSAGPTEPARPKKQGRVTKDQYDKALMDYMHTPPLITEQEFNRIIAGYQQTIQQERSGRGR